MDQRGRLRINLSQREFEVEGSEEFVRSFADRIGELLDLLDVGGLPVAVNEAEAPAAATADANRRLTEQGIKLGNPSQCVKQSLLAKRVFMLNKGRYRVSQQGRAHLRQLLGPVVPD